MLYKTIQTAIYTELIEKKSRFICILRSISDTDQVETILADIRKQYPGARHYCYACMIRNGNSIIEKYSDDGEPNSTAGLPMLNVLKQNELLNVIAVVVRYFGGTLLGTGGLVRAYSRSVIQTLDITEIITMEYSWRLKITLDYSYYANFQSKCLTMLTQVIDTDFADRVTIEAWIAEDKEQVFVERLNSISNQAALIEYLQQDFVPQKT